jgi:hypothetical protein
MNLKLLINVYKLKYNLYLYILSIEGKHLHIKNLYRVLYIISVINCYELFFYFFIIQVLFIKSLIN